MLRARTVSTQRPAQDADLSVQVAETFASIQGESTYAGLPCFFIRLAGCNLSCSYCDTPGAREPGRQRRLGELLAERAKSPAPLTCVTGGEPLLQPAAPALLAALQARETTPVLVETNGTRDLRAVPARSVAIMDIKCPGSGCCEATDWRNIERLRPQDEVKFVLCDRDDYLWARDVAARHELSARCHAVLFSPAAERLEPRRLAQWLLADGQPVRLQLQIHKILGCR